MSKTFTGGAVCREFESEAPVAEQMDHCRMQCSRKQFSFQMCLESGDGSRTFCNWRQSSTQLMPWYWMLWIGSWSLSPAGRVVVDCRSCRITEHELVDDNEASHVDKLVVLF